MPRPEPRYCACGCGTLFHPLSPTHRYCHPSHYPPKADHHHTPEYRAARKNLWRTWPHDAPCPHCGHPMTNEQKAQGKLDAGHVTDAARGGWGGLLRFEHARCNRAAGASMGNRLRRRPTLQPLQGGRDWTA